MERRARVISTAVFAGLVVIVVGAGLTWACTGPTFGTPATPGNPPAPGPETAAPVTPAAPAPAAPAPAATGTTGATVTSGAQATPQTTSGAARETAPNRTQAVPPRTVAPRTSTGVAGTQFAQRAQGATAGVTRSGGQAVFASPAAKADKRSGDRGARSTPSARTASGDLWNGFRPESRSSVFAAEATAAEQGSGAPITAALLALGLGAVGLVGSAVVLASRRRKAHAKAAGRNTTE